MYNITVNRKKSQNTLVMFVILEELAFNSQDYGISWYFER